MDEKKCSKCGETKPLDEFQRDSRNADGRRSPCGQCRREESFVRTRMREAEISSARREARAATEKRCSKCREVKPRDGFAKNKGRRDGLNSWCKDCLRDWRIANKDRQAKRKADYYYANRQSILDRGKRWRAENAEVISEKKAKYRSENREAHADRDRRYREANLEELRAKEAAYHLANPHVRWRSGYRQRVKRWGLTEVVEDFTKADVIERYGDSCAYCDAGEFEELDHFTPVREGGPHTLANVRPSCTGCNRSKKDANPDEWLAEQATLDDLTEDELDDLIDAEIDRWTQPKESK